MDIMQRTRPKGYNSKVWEVMYREAEQNKQWALDICLNKPEWFKQASNSSIEMIGEYLHLPAHKLAKEAYDYLHTRAHGRTFMGALDPSARERWESIVGRKIGIKMQWKYDHTKHTTSAVYRDKKWYDYTGKEISHE